MPTLRVLTVALLFFSACSTEDKTSDEGDTSSEAICTLTVTPRYPINGQTDTYARGPFEVLLSEPDASSTLSVTSADGVVIAGQTTTDEAGTLLTFTPDAPLDPNTSYTLTQTGCQGEAAISFSTSDLGSPLTASLTGRTFAVDPASGRFVAPEGADAIFGTALGGNVLLGVLGEGATIQMRGALSVPGAFGQDTCNRTVELPDITFSDSPYFELPEGDVTLTIAGSEVTIGGMKMSGTFSADGTWFGGGTLSGELDARTLGGLLASTLPDASPDAVCELLGVANIACMPCSSDGASYCVDFLLDHVIANDTGAPLELITEADCHETCALSCENAACPNAAEFPVCQ